MKQDERTIPEEKKEYKAKLDDKILYLLRLRAMQEEIVNRNPICFDHETLYNYLMNNQKSIDAMEKGTPYFEKLMKEIGQINDSTQDNPKFKVSVLTLKRLYGRIQSTSSASTSTLDCIAEFISNSRYKWHELQERVDALTEELENDCTWNGSSPIRVYETARPTRNGKVTKIYSVNLVQGDKLLITFDNGHRLELIYKGNNKYKVVSTDSRTLKIGYTLVITRMRCLGHIHEREVYDKDGNLTCGYSSDRIKTIVFEGSLDAELQRFCTALNSSSLDSSGNSRTFAAPKSKTGMNMKEMKKNLCVMGAGPLTFDVIVKREYPDGFVPGKRNKFEDKVMIQELGSNTGNVMCILGYFGWDSYPIAFLDDYPQGLQMKKDFERYHCNTRFVTNTRKGGSNIFTITHKLDNDGNLIKSRAKRHAPFSGFPRDKALTIDGKNATLPKFLEALDFLPDVYFFSNGGAGWRELGKYMRSKGVLVYYELQRMSSKELGAVLKCMKEADIVKFSDETVEDASFVDELKDKLVIQTLGEKGARFNLCGKGWVTLPPVVNENVVDTEGCGDWTTASFINALGKRGVLKLKDMTEAVVKECLEEAQQYASRNVSYLGTKGIIPTDMKFNLEPSTYEDPYEKEMDGRKGIKKTKIEKLEAVPETELMIYDAKDCLIYRSDYECLNGIERTFGKKECSVMSNFYPCKLPYIYNGEKVVFNSAEQAYHFFRYKEFPLIQDMVLRQKSGKDTMSACSGFKYVDSDHEQTRWMYMTLVEELKYLHCKEFREKILSLDDTILVESSGDTDIFGSTIPGSASKAVKFAKKKGLNLEGRYIGMNGCGRCIMAVRDKFRGWTDAQLKDYTPNPDIFMWWEESLEYKKQLTGMLF